MQPVTVNAFRIKYSSGALMCGREFGVCTTFISAKGIIRTTFEREVYSDTFGMDDNNFMPVKVTYEYKFKDNILAGLFEEYDLLALKPRELDQRGFDIGSWQMTIYTNGVNHKFKGSLAPEPFGEELADRIRELIPYQIVPMLF